MPSLQWGLRGLPAAELVACECIVMYVCILGLESTSQGCPEVVMGLWMDKIFCHFYMLTFGKPRASRAWSDMFEAPLDTIHDCSSSIR